jgi:hypothetical protein
MRNRYGRLIESWKVDLILERARRKGIRRHELDDALQEAVPAVLDFDYDAGHAAGAAERTALTAVIDRRLVDLVRARAAEVRRIERVGKLKGLGDGREPIDESAAGDGTVIDDVRAVVAGLPELERAVCEALAAGEPASRLAGRLGLSSYRLGRIVDDIRERFTRRGLTP